MEKYRLPSYSDKNGEPLRGSVWFTKVCKQIGFSECVDVICDKYQYMFTTDGKIIPFTIQPYYIQD